jgi:photosystem II stability/assembly factor-like uncharacterized protein
MKCLITLLFFVMLGTYTYPQWIQQQLPATVDVWGLETRDSLVFAGTEIGFLMPGYIFRSNDFGVSWDTLDGLPYAGGWSIVFSDSILVAGSFGWGLYLSSDLGYTWTTPDSGISSDENVHVILKHGNNLFAGTAGTGSGILRSSDNGNKWVSVNGGLSTFDFLSLASNGFDIYAGTASTGQVYCSTDNGNYWLLAGSGLPANSGIASLAVKDSNVYAGLGSGEGVYYSSDNGSNWINISEPFFINQVWTIVLADTNLFVGTNGDGVFLTQNNGLSWTPVNEGLTNLYIRSLIITENDYIFAGTTNGYVCYRPLSEIITGLMGTNNKQYSYSLSQNYPNPFNPATIIRYSIPHSSQVQITVYDILGNEIEILVNEEKQSGTYELTWNAANLPSGVYFYQLKAGTYLQTRKMILLR